MVGGGWLVCGGWLACGGWWLADLDSYPNNAPQLCARSWSPLGRQFPMAAVAVVAVVAVVVAVRWWWHAGLNERTKRTKQSNETMEQNCRTDENTPPFTNTMLTERFTDRKNGTVKQNNQTKRSNENDRTNAHTHTHTHT